MNYLIQFICPRKVALGSTSKPTIMRLLLLATLHYSAFSA